VTLVELAYDAYTVSTRNRNALVVLHGLLCVLPPTVRSRSRSSHWSVSVSATRIKTGTLSLCAHHFARPVYAPNFRNHGHSPAAVPHTYHAMATDLLDFLTTHDLLRGRLPGHSMGGKAALAAARPGNAVGSGYYPRRQRDGASH
jgi:pimeloyl-ACP methyl ester carboxylesterase